MKYKNFFNNLRFGKLKLDFNPVEKIYKTRWRNLLANAYYLEAFAVHTKSITINLEGIAIINRKFKNYKNVLNFFINLAKQYNKPIFYKSYYGSNHSWKSSPKEVLEWYKKNWRTHGIRH